MEPEQDCIKKGEVKFTIAIKGEKVSVNAPPALIAQMFHVSLKKFAVARKMLKTQ